MTHSSRSTSEHQATLSKPALRALPDERFWKRYSAHHEFPLSLSSSVILHVAGILVLFFGGFLLVSFGANREPRAPTVDVLFAGSGNPNGPGGAPGPNATPQEKEAVGSPDESQPDNSQPIDPTPLIAPKNPGIPVTPADPAKPTRWLDEQERKIGEGLKIIGDKISRLKPGSRGPGEGGPGGPTAKLIIERRARWTILFNTHDGFDYLRQLHDLHAFVAVQQQDGRYMVYRDLSRQPVAGTMEDIFQFSQISWHDTKPESVRSLAGAMGLPEAPSEIIAFFPAELEKELLDKEAKYSGGKPEDEIEETVFVVLRPRERSGYQVTVKAQRIKQKR